ncbi:MAG: DUF1365 domain-containing protein [Vicinamibacteraceae bacterium]
MESCFYEGWVAHRRQGDVPHAFRFPLAMLYLDLDELDDVFRRRWCWSTTRPALAWVRRADHLGPAEVPLADAVRDLVASRTGTRPEGPIRLLTHPRYGGYVFNPLSLFYCFDVTGDHVETVVADVTNTPWGERHQYVLTAGEGDAADTVARHEKAFHVSPFLPMTLDYDWRIGRPGPALGVQITARSQGVPEAASAPVFTATLTLRRRPIEGRTLAGVLVRFPAQTAQVVAGIYWQALKLWWRGAPFHAHPRSPATSGEAR